MTKFPTYSIKGKPVEYKTFSFLVKSVDPDQGIVTGLASPVIQDRQRDIVEPGAYAQTLSEGQSRMQNGRKFMYACLWMHIPEQPTGGVIAGQEVPEGLDVTMKYDISTNAAGFPNNPTATMVFSGTKVGYTDELSVGYIAVKYDYDKQGVRHIRQMDLIEISGVTMGFAANPAALVTGVKSMAYQKKSVCGDTSLPIGPRDASWDGSEAHSHIVTWATKEDGSIDPEKMKQVHLQCDGDEDKITSYNYAFCDIEDDKPVINVGGVIACAEALAGARNADPGEDKDGMQKKVETLYAKINKKYPKDTPLVASWTSKDKQGNVPMQFKDFNDIHQAGKAADCLEDWCDLLNQSTQTMIQIFSMSDSPESDIQNYLDQFSQAVLKEWLPAAVEANVGQYLSDRGYGSSSPDTPYVPYSMRVGGYDYSTRHDSIAGKVGATFSRATQGALQQHQDEMKAMLKDHQKMMTESTDAMMDKVDGLANLYNQQPDDGNQPQDNNNGKSLLRREPSRTLTRTQPLNKGTADLTIEDLASIL